MSPEKKETALPCPNGQYYRRQQFRISNRFKIFSYQSIRFNVFNFTRPFSLKLVLAISLLFSIPATADTFGQTVTFSGNNVSLQKVFQVIQDQTGYGVFIDHTLLIQTRNVNLTVKDATVQEVLRLCLKSQPLPLTFAIEGTTITILKKKEEEISAPAALGGPGGKIEGIVYNEAGQPLGGANVTVKETGRGTITNAKGEFVISGVPVNGTLVVSFIGYAPQMVKIKDGSKVMTYLKVTKNELDKVVVQAYGTTTQRLNTGNIVTVTKEQIERQPVMNALAALEGAVPGLIVTQTNGYASAPFKIELRGRSTISTDQPSEPLYIIDGVPQMVLNLGTSNYDHGSSGFDQAGLSPAGGQSPFFSINPSDIESITVLKDADATAIYGSRGANGVIIINTKKGKAGKTIFDINAYQGISKITKRYSVLNTRQYLQMRREAFKNDQGTYGLIPGVTIPDASNAYDLLTWDTTRNTDWQKFYWGGMGHTTDAELSLSGGDKQNTFRIAGSYHYETNIFTKSGSDTRTTLQFNYTHKSLDQRLTLSFTSVYSATKSDLIAIQGNVLESPDGPTVFDSQGDLNWSGWKPVQGNLGPWGSLFAPYTSKTGFLNDQFNFGYQLAKGLIFSTQVGYSSAHSSNYFATPIVSQDPEYSPKGYARAGNTNNTNFIVEPQLDYKNILWKGKLNILLGASTQSVSTDFNSLYGYGYTNDNLINSIGSAPLRQGNDGYGQYKYASIFGRINYNWGDKYLLNLSARRDGSSRFGPGKQYGNFGSIGAAWIFTEENWLKQKQSVFSFGKLRASYGVTGNDQIGDYGYLTQWSPQNLLPYQGSSAYLPLLHANPNLEWETNYKLEVALNLGFFNDRVTAEVSWYRNHCGNQLISYPLSIITGFSHVIENSPALIENKGWEIILKGKIIDTKTFGWSVNFNIGANRNKLLAYPNLATSSFASVFTIGQSLSTKYLLHFTGVDPLTGQYTYQDKNHDGQITYYYNQGHNDLYNRDMAIKADGGFGTDFRYRGLQMNLFFNFRKWILPSAILNGQPGTIEVNQSSLVLDHWQKPGDRARFSSFTTQYRQSDAYFGSSDGAYSDASFIRLRNISLSYDFPAHWIRKANFQGCKIYLRAENLFIITKFNGDPESGGIGSLPPAKIITGGLQFNL